MPSGDKGRVGVSEETDRQSHPTGLGGPKPRREGLPLLPTGISRSLLLLACGFHVSDSKVRFAAGVIAGRPQPGG